MNGHLKNFDKFFLTNSIMLTPIFTHLLMAIVAGEIDRKTGVGAYNGNTLH